MAGVRRIGLVLCPNFDFMGLAVTSPFAVANRYVADTTYDIHVLSEAGGLLRAGCGPAVETEPLSEPSAFDTIIVAAGISLPEPSPDLVAYLREAARSTRRLAGLCLGAFALADAGLLSGRRATTHWRYAPQFRARYPDCHLDIAKIFVADGNLWTSAGMSAGIDLAVGMVERDHVRSVARTVARGLVMERRRAGGQAQHSALLDFDAPSDRIQTVLAYARQNLQRSLTTEDLAAVACASAPVSLRELSGPRRASRRPRRSRRCAWRPPSIAFTSTRVSFDDSGRATTVETDRWGQFRSCSEVWKKTVTWSVPSPSRRRFSPSRVAWAATACSFVARSSNRSEKLPVTAQPFRVAATSSRSRQATPRSSCTRRSPTTVMAFRTARVSRSRTWAALSQPNAPSLRAFAGPTPQMSSGGIRAIQWS